MYKNIFNLQRILIFIVIGCFQPTHSQNSTYQISTVAFYNAENLFDTENNPNTYDEDYTPEGKKLWTEERLREKLRNLSGVISQIGYAKTNQAPAIIGLAEIENKSVLMQLMQQEALQNTDYDFAHFESPDKRGIDVALLFDRKRFTVSASKKHMLLLKDEEGKRIYTRDQLCVSGYLGDDLIYIIINHWPSRRGGTKRSNPKRVEAAKLCAKITDSIYQITPNAKLIIMGDFNDDPTDDSFKAILKTKADRNLCLATNDLYNPMENMKNKGMGTLAYRDHWNIFDQLIFSKSLLDSTGLQLYQTKIFKPKFLTQKKGKYKGYPKRTSNTEVGYSDHFPVYSYLIKRIN